MHNYDIKYHLKDSKVSIIADAAVEANICAKPPENSVRLSESRVKTDKQHDFILKTQPSRNNLILLMA